jgi:peptidoglycan hydrolase-like protein with peptidoglycan-binding domain
MPDATLTAALKQAKANRMFFAFIPKGADGKLIVSKAKVPAKEIAEAKKQTGGGNAITGKCYGEGATMVFQVAKAAPATLAAALKKVAKRDTGLSIDADVRVAGDADAEEEAAPAAPAGGGNGKAAPPAAAGHPTVLGLQKALKTLGYDPGKLDGVMGRHTRAAVVKFQQASGLMADGIAGPKTQASLAVALKGGAAPPGGVGEPPALPPEAPAGGAKATPGAPDHGPWLAARHKAVTGLKALAGKIAATKHPSAAGVLKELQYIISRLPAKVAPHEIDKVEVFVREDETITAAEEIPDDFHDLDIREPLLKALAAMRQ